MRSEHSMVPLSVSSVLIGLTVAITGCTAAENAPGPTESVPAPAPSAVDPSQRIAFGRWSASESRDTPPVIWTADADGRNPQPAGAQRGWYIEWSPDRSHLIFDFADESGNEHIGRVGADGTGFEQLTDGTGFYADPAYSPDGETIAFAYSAVPEGDPGFAPQLWLMNVDASNLRPLMTAGVAGTDWEPVFSPDGAHIVFTRDQEQDGGVVSAIHVVDVDGTDLRPLTEFEDYVEHPRWSPDGSTVIYNVESRTGGLDGARNGIWTVPAAGGEPAQLLPTNETLHGFKPSYSPDGERILFGCARRGDLNEDLCVMDADGTGVEVIIETSEFENHGVWY